MNARPFIAVLAAVPFALPIPALAAGGAGALSIDNVQQRGATLRVDVSLHAVDPAQVHAGDLSVTLAGKPVAVDLASSNVTSSNPVSPQRRALLLLDTSGSMAGVKISSARAAAIAFLRAAPPDVEVGLGTVADRTAILDGPTRDRSALETSLAKVRAAGQTHLYDGIQTALGALGSDGQRLLVVLSDGADTGSSATLGRVLRRVRGAGVTVDAIGLETSAAQHQVLSRLAAAGGGRLLTANAGAGLASAFRSTAQDLVSRMTLTLQPPAELAGRSVPLVVRAALPTGTAEATTTVLLATTLTRSGGPATSPAAISPRHSLWGSARGLGLGLLAIFLALWLFGIAALGGRSHGRRLRDLLSPYSARAEPLAATSGDASVLGGTGLMRSALSFAERVLQKQGREARLALLLERAAVRLRPNEWLVVRGIAALIGIALLGLVGHNVVVGVLAGGSIGLMLPQMWLKEKAKRRQKAFVERLPDSLQLVAGSLSAGYSLLQALDGLVQEGEEPVAGEVGRALATARLGVPIEDALEEVAARVDSPDFSWTAMAIRVQREVGGNLGEVLLTVGDTLRERAALRRQVRALSAEGRLSAYILIAIPGLLGLYEMLFRRAYASVLWTTPLGIGLLVTTLVLMSVGTVWMRAVVNVEV